MLGVSSGMSGVNSNKESSRKFCIAVVYFACDVGGLFKSNN